MIGSMIAVHIASLLTVSLVFAAPADRHTTTFISAPLHVPVDASKIVDRDFQAWASAVHWWPDFAGNNTSPNRFSQSLVKIITEKQGSSPVFRVGGTSADRTYFIPEQKESIIFLKGGALAIPRNLSIGPVFFEGFDQFPGARYHFQVNFARHDRGAVDAAIVEARAALKHIKGNLESLEIGNEVDIYRGTVRPKNWKVKDYVSEWLQFAEALTEKVFKGNPWGLDPDLIYQAPVYAKPVPKHSGFNLPNTFEHGINRRKNIKSSAVHQYMNGAALNPARSTRQNLIMNHTEIVHNITNFRPAQKYLAKHFPGMHLYLAETNSLAKTSNADEYTAVFGSALWTVDDLLYAMSQNIDRVYLQQGTTFDFAAWQPVTVNGRAPYVKPPYYGNLFIADAMGETRKLQAKNIDLHSDVLSAYALYSEGQLAKYAIVNLLEYNSTNTRHRPSKHVSLKIPNLHGGHVWLKYLSAPGADADDGITWGGRSWNYSSTADGQVEVKGVERSIPVRVVNGRAKFKLDASEAVLVTWQSRLDARGRHPWELR